MDHRYGRHGPDAWLKWRSRHYLPPEQMPVLTSNTKVYVYELSKTERIIYIVTSEPQRYEETGQPPSFTRIPLSLQAGDKVIELPPSSDSTLIGRAQVQAINDARKARGSTTIRWDRIEKRLEG